jgi:hypothetical protein
MFIPYLYTPEGFRVTQEKYIALEDTTDVPADQKRTITVCNLFANQQMAIDEIAKLLDTNRRIVVSALLHEGILDRRDSEWTPTVERRHAVNYHLPRVVSAGRVQISLWAVRFRNRQRVCLLQRPQERRAL